MRKFEVTVTRKFADYAIIEVEANSINEAKKIALDSDLDWQCPRDNNEYVSNVDEIRRQHIIQPCLKSITASD